MALVWITHKPVPSHSPSPIKPSIPPARCCLFLSTTHTQRASSLSFSSHLYILSITFTMAAFNSALRSGAIRGLSARVAQRKFPHLVPSSLHADVYNIKHAGCHLTTSLAHELCRYLPRGSDPQESVLFGTYAVAVVLRHCVATVRAFVPASCRLHSLTLSPSSYFSICVL